MLTVSAPFLYYTCEFWFDQFHGYVVHYFSIHRHGDLWKTVGGKDGIESLVDSLAFQQPTVETVFGGVDT